MLAHEFTNKIKRVCLPAIVIGSAAALAAGYGNSNNANRQLIKPEKTPEAISLTRHNFYETFRGCAPIGELAITKLIIHNNKSVTFYGDANKKQSGGEYASIMQEAYDSSCNTTTHDRQIYTQSSEPAGKFTTIVKASTDY